MEAQLDYFLRITTGFDWFMCIVIFIYIVGLVLTVRVMPEYYQKLKNEVFGEIPYNRNMDMVLGAFCSLLALILPLLVMFLPLLLLFKYIKHRKNLAEDDLLVDFFYDMCPEKFEKNIAAILVDDIFAIQLKQMGECFGGFFDRSLHPVELDRLQNLFQQVRDGDVIAHTKIHIRKDNKLVPCIIFVQDESDSKGKEAFGLKLYTDKELLPQLAKFIMPRFPELFATNIACATVRNMLPEQLKSIADSLGTFFERSLTEEEFQSVTAMLQTVETGDGDARCRLNLPKDDKEIPCVLILDKISANDKTVYDLFIYTEQSITQDLQQVLDKKIVFH